MNIINLKGVETKRAYLWADDKASYEIEFSNPQEVQFRDGGSTHRVKDEDGSWYIVPAPGYFGCVIRFEGTVVA